MMALFGCGAFLLRGAGCTINDLLDRDIVTKNLYWAESGDLVAISSDSSFYVLKYNMSTNKGKGVAEFSDFDMDQLNQVVQDVNLDSNDEGGWEVYSKKNKNKGGAPVRPPTNVWANPAGSRGGTINYNPAPNAVPPSCMP